MPTSTEKEKVYKFEVEKETTVNELLSDSKSLFYKTYKNDKNGFLDYKGDTDKSNFDRIWEKYDFSDSYYLASTSAFDRANNTSVIKEGTILIIGESSCNIELVALQGKDIFLERNDGYRGFWSDKLEELQNDPQYTKAKEIKSINGDIVAKYVEYDISVWIWVRSLDKILNISPFVSSLETSVGNGGGNFNLTLTPVADLNKLISYYKDYISYFEANGGNKTLKTDYFNKKLQQNDVVFIRFEKLKIEKDRQDQSDFEVSNSNLPNKVYDMIGLIDNVNSLYTASSNDITINISGRDLMKLLIEDGSYFFPISMIKNVESIFIDPNNDSRWFKRNFVTGEFQNMFIYSKRSIRDTVGFIINQLSNLGVVSDDLFSAYKDTGEIINISGANRDYLQWNEVNGIWKIINVLIDNQLEDRRITNSQISQPNGTLYEQINNFCQKPFVEFFGDTYGDKYSLIVREQPFTKKAIEGWLGNNIIEIGVEDVLSYNLSWETDYYTWYQLNPQDVFLGAGNSISMAYIPVIFFPEFADNFGNHRMVVTSNYSSRLAYAGVDGESNINKFKASAINDLVLMIECYNYLPFTRKGTITINRDRRIKYGTWVRFKPTGEIFYVNNVRNSYSSNINGVDGTTMLTVNRGMVEDYISGKKTARNEDGSPITDKNGQPLRPSYFNIVNLEIINKYLVKKLATNRRDVVEPIPTQYSEINRSTSQNVIVNPDVFDFFLKRKQFNG